MSQYLVSLLEALKMATAKTNSNPPWSPIYKGGTVTKMRSNRKEFPSLEKRGQGRFVDRNEAGMSAELLRQHVNHT
jgi:hypothetical protein